MKKTIRCWACIRPDGYPDMKSISYTGKKDCIREFVQVIEEPYRKSWSEYELDGWRCRKVRVSCELDTTYYKHLKE